MVEKRILIDSLDGFEFQELCAEIYRGLGYTVQQVQYTGDEGRDLILKSPTGETIVAECKHWPTGSIGRPVVQKLHSAIKTLPAQKGIILTTGSFAKPARDYVKKLDVSIDLIDLFRLRDLASKAGITLTSSNDPVPILSFATSGDETLKSHLDKQVFVKFVSIPASAGSMFSIGERSIEFKPAYLVSYSLRQDFATSVGFIHSLDIQNDVLLIDAQHGATLRSDLAHFLQRALALPTAEAPDLRSISRKTFKLGAAEIKEIAKDQIIRTHSTSVSYRGRNNHSYVANCVPSRNRIFLNDIRQVYMPEQNLQITALNHHYSLNLVEDGQDLCWLEPPSVFMCQLCGQRFQHGLVCNSCGATVHEPRSVWKLMIQLLVARSSSSPSIPETRLVRKHSFYCDICGKTICKNCAYWVRRWLVFKNVICLECGQTYPESRVHRLQAKEQRGQERR